MFTVFCDRHGTEVLLSWDNIVWIHRSILLP